MFTAAAAAEGSPGKLCDILIVPLASPDQLIPCCIALEGHDDQTDRQCVQ
jgi:hypothetical protein